MSFGYDVAKVSSVTLIIQILNILLMPVVLRIYGPDVFGEFALYEAIIAPIFVFVAMGYPAAIMLPKNEKDAMLLAYLCILISVVFLLLTAVIIFFVYGYSDHPVLLINYLLLIPLFVFGHGLYLTLRFLNLRYGYIGNTAYANLARFVANNSYLISMGALYNGAVAHLIFGTLAGMVLNLVVLGFQVSRKLYDNLKVVTLNELLRVAKRYKKFPLYIIWVDQFGGLIHVAPVYILSYYFSQSVVGYYSLGLRLLNMPMSLIGNAVGDVYFSRISRVDSKKGVLVLERLFHVISILSIPPFLVLILIGEEIFSIIFGVAWSQAGVYSQVLSIYILARFLFLPSTYIAMKMEKQQVLLLVNVLLLVFHVISLVIGGVIGDVYVSLLLITISSTCVYVGFGFYMFKMAGVGLVQIINSLKYPSLNSVLIVVFLFLVDSRMTDDSVVLVSVSVISLALYYAIIVKVDSIINMQYEKIIYRIGWSGK